MYDHSARKPTYLVCCTPPDVGPGSYDILKKYTCDIAHPKHVSFNSLMPRAISFENKELSSTPAPSFYSDYLVASKPHVKGGVITSADPVKPKTNCNLGPGRYNIPINYIGIKKVKHKGLIPTIHKGQKIIADILNSRVLPKVMSNMTPSDSDDIIKNTPFPKKLPVGPTYYHIKDKFNPEAKNYQGPMFGKSRSLRKLFDIKDFPGPAQYNTDKEKHSISCLIPEKKDFLPRWHEILVIDSFKKNIPGPGSYSEKLDRKLCPQVKSANFIPAPFNSRCQRFGKWKDDVPAPNEYNNSPSALTILDRLTSMGRPPFGQKANRFVDKTALDDDTPGPQKYYIPDPFMINKAKYLKAGQRKEDSYHRSLLRAISQAEYNKMVKNNSLEASVEERHLPQGRVFHGFPMFSSFRKSYPPRFTSGDPNSPSPASYNAGEAYLATQTKCCHRLPRYAGCNQQDCYFLSTTEHDAYSGDRQNFPGPSDYCPKLIKCQIPGCIIGKEKRSMKIKTDITPSPASYKLSPQLDNTVECRTFNVSLFGNTQPFINLIRDARRRQRMKKLVVNETKDNSTRKMLPVTTRGL